MIEIKSEEREKLLDKYQDKLDVDAFLSRKIVSFQANKKTPIYRWFKYKEGFSSELVKYYISKFGLEGKTVLDPFAGTGTTLFASGELGCASIGIELLPVGVFYMNLRKNLLKIQAKTLNEIKSNLWSNVEEYTGRKNPIKHIPITDGAFSKENELLLNKYLEYSSTLDFEYSEILRFVAYSVLESISFTRKDGQYLRWDHRSNRRAGKTKFDKGIILDFKTAIDNKFSEILEDISNPTEDKTLFPEPKNIDVNKIEVFQDSCLNRLPSLKEDSIDIVITSPPYCNRYDYTRTYALELVFLGTDNEKIKELRQSMLSCTVENKSKVDELRDFYSNLSKSKTFEKVDKVYNSCKAMSEINEFLNELKIQKKLNNSGIARMVKNYFYEMCFTIYELSRVLKKGGRVIMVNDNVQYNGEQIPVDLILSEFASHFGLETEKIYVLQQNKGNSSQQMGNHGRTPLRKCVYSWIKK